MNFELWLEKHESKGKHIAKIDIFDFDDTIFKAPTKRQAQNGIARYNSKYIALPDVDMISNHSNYWMHPCSLEPPVVPSPCPFHMLNHQVAQEFNRSSRDPKRLTVVMTGRPPTLRKQVERILGDFKMKPDRLLLMPRTGKTADAKVKHLQDMLDELPHVMDVEMWDDRGPKKAKLMGKEGENHVKIFKDFLEKVHGKRQAEDLAWLLKYKVNEIDPRDDIVDELMAMHPDFGGRKKK